MFDFAVIADLTVLGGSVYSCMGNMEDQDYTQQCVHSVTLRKGVAEKTLEENSVETKIKEVITNYSEEASSQSLMGDF